MRPRRLAPDWRSRDAAQNQEYGHTIASTCRAAAVRTGNGVAVYEATRSHPIRGAGPIVETSPPSYTFKMTRLIGGKLRALYDEEAQPCSSRMDDLLKILAAAESGTNT